MVIEVMFFSSFFSPPSLSSLPWLHILAFIRAGVLVEGIGLDWIG